MICSASQTTQDLSETDAEAEAEAGGASRRLLCITLPKRPPAPGVVVWWQGVFSGHPSIDLTGLEDRDTAKQTVFQQNWNDAHRQFKEKMKNHKKMIIDPQTGEIVGRED